MKSKFYLAFVLAGIAPIVGLAGFYLYTASTALPSSPQATVSHVVQVDAQEKEAEVETIASSLLNAIKSTNADSLNLATHNSAADLETFVNSHNGVSGVAVVNAQGSVVRTTPSSVAIIGPHYSLNPEFQRILSKFNANGDKNYEFYTTRLGYPAFIFAVPLTKALFAEVVLKIGSFFTDMESGSDYFIVDAASGQFLYHSDPSQLNTSFNPDHEAWLNAVQTGLMAQKSGISSDDHKVGAAYGYLGFGQFGVVHTFPLTTVVAAPPTSTSGSGLSGSVLTPMSLGFVVALAFLFIGAGVASRKLVSPLRRIAHVVLAAAEDSHTLTPEIVSSFGNDEAGHIVQALAIYNEKVQDNKSNEIRNLNDQYSSLQRQTRQYQTEAQEKGQQLVDKLKELEALKGMSEGLRNQSEQSKQEIARLKGELSVSQTTQLELTGLQGKYTQLQTQLKTAEAKAVQAVSAASAIQVSQVRAAAIRTMSEELKNTLGIIKGYVSSVISSGQGGINEKQQEFLGMVINRSARLEKFINDLVDIYQVEIEQKEAKTEEVNLASEIETFAFNFQTQTELKNLKFKIEAKPELPKVPVVRRRLTQLLNILYLQLIKDAPKGSTIPIRLETVSNGVKVTVQDPGLIVVPESLPKLFDEFYDPKHPASPQLAGTGLKLALVKTIMSAYGGSVLAEKSDPGTNLILTFATKAAPVAASTGTPTAIVETKGTVPPSSTLSAPTAKPPLPAMDLDETFGLKPSTLKPSIPVPPAVVASSHGVSAAGITVGAKIPSSPSASGIPPLPPISGLTVGSKIPTTESSSPMAPLPPIPGLTVGAKPPAGDGLAGSLPSLPPIPGLTVGAKPPSAGTPPPAPKAPPLPTAPVPPPPGVAPKPIPVPGILDALISGKIPSVTAPGLKPTMPPPASAPVPAVIPKPVAPPSVAPTPPTPAPTGPLPTVSSIPPKSVPPAPSKPMVSTSLEDLLKMKSSTPPPQPTPPPKASPSHEEDFLE